MTHGFIYQRWPLNADPIYEYYVCATCTTGTHTHIYIYILSVASFRHGYLNASFSLKVDTQTIQPTQYDLCASPWA